MEDYKIEILVLSLWSTLR